ncbi:tetratricopeptide repeat protein, partial [Nocardiopsis flavescens]
MTDEDVPARVPATHIDMRWIVAGGDVIGQVVNLPRPLPTALFSVPEPPARLAGRVAELEALLAALAPHDGGTGTDTSPAGDASAGVVVSAVAGMGGVGKTALAWAAGTIAHHKEWFCAQLYVDLLGYTPDAKALTAEAALDVLLRQMGEDAEKIPAEASELASFYRSALAKLSRDDARNRPVLVVADNARSAAQVRPLLPGTGGHRLLATTRGGLYSLAGARHVDLDVLDPADSLALLAFALTTAHPQDPRADDAVGLGRLAEVCGHLPLALEIVAAQLARIHKVFPDNTPQLSPDTLSERLEKAVSRVDKMQDGGSDVERSRVLRAVFDTSLDQLTPDEVRVFLLVASAPGPTTSTTSAAVLTGLDPDEAEEVLEELQAAHLLTQPVPGRWGAHDLLTDHAATHPHPPEDRAQAMGRLLDHYTATTSAASQHVRALPGQEVPGEFPDREAALEWLDAERATLVAAALAAPALGHHRGAISLPLAMAYYLNHRRRFEEWKQVSDSARQAAHAVGDVHGEAMAWNNLGSALRQVRRFAKAIEAHTHARDLHHQVGDAHGEASAWNNLGLALAEVRRFEEAIDAHRHDLTYCQQVGDVHGEASAWNNLGLALRQVRRFEEAIEAHTRAQQAFHQVGDAHGEASAWNNLGSALQQVRRFEEAIEAHTHARDLHHQVGDAHGEASAWNNLGSALRQVRRFEEAIEAHTHAQQAFQQVGDAHSEASAWNNLGSALRQVRRFAKAIEAHTHAQQAFHQVGDAHGEASAWNNLGSALQQVRRFEEAIEAHT